MEKSDQSSKKHCNCPFCKLFMSQLFEIGNSAGSLIGEAVNLFRIFQRLSATRSFVTKFSSDSKGMFSWATDLVKIITSNIDIKPFETYEFYWLYSIAIPLFIFTLISCLFNGYKQCRYFILWFPFLFLGLGTALLIVEPNLAYLAYIVVGAVMLIIIFICYFCCLKKRWEALEQGNTNSIIDVKNTYQFTYSICGSFFIFITTSLPLLIRRKTLSIIIFVVICLIVVISLIVEICQNCRYQEKKSCIYRKYSTKIVGFLISCLSLLIIPSTDTFTELIKVQLNYAWITIVSYISMNLLIPIITTFLMIKTNYSEICVKYKDKKTCNINCYCYIELIDIIKQVAYAIVAAFDLPIACIGIEVIWFLLILITRPYVNVSDYSLSFGSSLVMFMSNGAIVYSNYRNTGLFSFKTTVIFVIIACIPAILSGYLFFIFDFNAKVEDLSEQEKINEDNLQAIYLISLYVQPFIVFLCGLSLIVVLSGIYF